MRGRFVARGMEAVAGMRGPEGNGLLRVPGDLAQAALDAAAVLQVRRSAIAERLTRGEPCGATVAAGGGNAAINTWMHEETWRWREMLSVSASAYLPQLRVSVPHNRDLVSNGLRMVSVFHHAGLDPETRRLLAGETLGSYRFGIAPVQMKIVDRRYVLLHGPFLGGETTIMAVTEPDCLDAAWRYWHCVMNASFPAKDELGDYPEFTPRLRQVVALLAEDTRDEAIAETLGVSVRTVRSDIAELMGMLGVRTRFAAGLRSRELVRDW